MTGILEIIDAVAALACERLPQLTRIYTELVPRDFERPSLLIQSVTNKIDTANRATVAVTAYLTLTLLDVTDDYAHSNMTRLLRWQQDLLELFLPGVLLVNGRALAVKASTGGRDWDKAYVDLQLTYYDDRGLPVPDQSLMETVETTIEMPAPM